MLSSEAAGMPETYVSEHTSESHNLCNYSELRDLENMISAVHI